MITKTEIQVENGKLTPEIMHRLGKVGDPQLSPNYGKILSTDRGWTIDSAKMALTNNARFMHCLPVRRNMIVTDDVIESERSIVIPEAANREISATTVLKMMLESL